jgi:hypothetical protein
MNMTSWFEDIPVIGKLPPEQAIEKLREVGEDDVADMLEMTQEAETKSFRGPGAGLRGWLHLQDRPWEHTAHTFGYLAPSAPGNDALPILPIGSIPADTSLKHSRIKITLSRLCVCSYPGGGMHRVLLHFFAQNQLPHSKEDVHFNATYRVREGEHAGINGYPIFIGLNVGDEGLSFRCRTINVTNDQDEEFLNILESPVFKGGLHLITTAQPAIAPLASIAYGLAQNIAKRNRNVSVQDFDLGLDFSTIAMNGRLAEGSYLAVQIPENQQVRWNWQDWVFDPGMGQVVKRSDYQQLIPYNYLVFSISRYEGK